MNFYEIIKTKKLGRGFPDYWTQLFAEHVGGKGEWKVAGVLPLTFTAKGGTAADWVIEGNNDVGENLFDIETQIVGEGLDTNGSTVPSQTSNRSDYIAVNAETDYCQYNNVIDTTYRVFQFFDANKEFLSFVAVTVSNKAHVFATPQNCAFCRISYPKNSTEVMFVKGSTAPDHYIPYQIGVGQRTANLFNATIEQGGLAGGAEYNSSIRVRTTFMPNMLDAGTYTINASGVNAVVVNYFDDNKTYTGGVTTWRTLPFTFNISNRCYVRFAFRLSDSQNVTPSDISNIMLVKGSTAPQAYIPYGYEIPLTVNNTTQDIYIGDTPLTAGQSVSKTSTGVDIELFDGENTVSTTLYNKPTMEIKYIKRR